MSTKGSSSTEATPKKQSFSVIEMFEQLAQWAENNAMALVIAFAGVVLACVIAVGVSIYSDSSNKKQFAKAYALEEQFAELLTAPEAAANPDSPTPNAVSFSKAKAEELQPQILEFVKSHSKSDAARNLAIRWVSKLYDIGLYEMGAEVMQAIKPNKSSTLSGLALLLKGTTLLETGKTEEAIMAFNEILGNDHWQYVHPEASYQLSMAQLKNNDPDAAISSLKRVHEQFSDQREVSTQATKMMRWLQYQKAQKL